jgi:hypothetical protein
LPEWGAYDSIQVKNSKTICKNSIFRYISDMRAAQTSSKSILVLGAGYVSAPVVDYLSSKG